MSALRLTSAELVELLESPYVDDVIASGVSAVVVAEPDPTLLTAASAGSVPLVTIGLGTSAAGLGCIDVAVTDESRLVDVVASVEAHPIASATLVVLLRTMLGIDDLDVALAAESAAYSLLQAGPEFRAWRAEATATAPPADTEPAVLTTRSGDVLHVELNRPHRHNAFSRSMRDGLCEALAIALVDHSIERIDLRGRGRSFCSGGDLGEFGSSPDPARAHITRLTRSPARSMHRLRDRTVVHLHGACMGAGIELPAFAAHVVADPATRIELPEIGLGLVPGAGGTVSITRRVGRQRCAELALCGSSIDAETALRWGLVDEIR